MISDTIWFSYGFPMVFLLKDPKNHHWVWKPSHEDQGVSSGAGIRAAHTADLAAEVPSNVSGSVWWFHGDFMEIYDDLVIWFYYLPWFPAQTSDLEWLEMWKKQIWFLRLKYIWDFHSYKMNWNLWLNENRFKYCKIPGFIQISVLSGASTPSGIKFVPWFCGKITSLKGGTIFRFS